MKLRLALFAALAVIAALTLPAAASGVSPTSSPTATAAPEANAGTATPEQRAREWWNAFVSGNVDRTQFTDTMNGAMTAEVISNVGLSLKHLGAPTSFDLIQTMKIQNDTAYAFTVTLAATKWTEILALTPDGKIDGLFFRPLTSPATPSPL